MLGTPARCFIDSEKSVSADTAISVTTPSEFFFRLQPAFSNAATAAASSGVAVVLFDAAPEFSGTEEFWHPTRSPVITSTKTRSKRTVDIIATNVLPN
jgi:hypothetical protein